MFRTWSELEMLKVDELIDCEKRFTKDGVDLDMGWCLCFPVNSWSSIVPIDDKEPSKVIPESICSRIDRVMTCCLFEFVNFFIGLHLIRLLELDLLSFATFSSYDLLDRLFLWFLLYLLIDQVEAPNLFRGHTWAIFLTGCEDIS